jgi:hypothetical protein
MGLSVAAFKELLKPFSDEWKSKKTSNNCKGRKAIISPADILGLVLHWLNSTMCQKTLSEIFGLVPSAVSAFLGIGLIVLHSVLSKLPCAKVSWPTHNEMEEYAKMIHAREPLLSKSIGFVDGLNIPLLESGDSDVQNAYYNGWLSACYVSNVFVFAPTGKIIYAAINRPGSWHDSAVCKSLYEKLKLLESDFNILADSAFTYTKSLKNR